MADTMAQWAANLLATSHILGKPDLQRGVFLEVKGVGYGDWRPAFDSSLILHNGCQNHTLTLVLKIFYNQILPSFLPNNLRMPFVESGTPPRILTLKPWAGGEWSTFIAGVKREAAKWNNQFWLIPPAGFDKLDIKANGRTIRPNIYCHLHLEMLPGVSGAYNKIDVVNFDTQGVPASAANSGYSRSNAGQYDDLDVKPRSQQTQDETGTWRTARNYSTIVHEIGHSLGLPHIGVTHQDPLCQMSIIMEQITPSGTILPALFHGGSNGQACYGHLGNAVRGGNVMGGGTSFEESNAAPWAQRLAVHTNTKASDWTVALRKAPAPKHF